MGYNRHHAIVVTTYSEAEAERAREAALAAFRERFGAVADEMVSPLLRVAINNWYTFLVGPDGSYEERAESDLGDLARDNFVAWLEANRFDGGSSPWYWVEVQYGDENGETAVTRDSDQRKRDAP